MEGSPWRLDNGCTGFPPPRARRRRPSFWQRGGGGLNPAHAEDECGTASASQTVVCDTGNYDSSEGNVFYQLPENTSKTDYSFELKDGLHISGTRGNAQVPADQETDDHSRRWNKPGETWAVYGAFWVDTGFDYDGDITVRSAADITANGSATDPATIKARGLAVRQTGKSGDISIHVTGGDIRSVGSAIRAEIDSRYDGSNSSYTGDNFKDEDYRGDILIDISGGTIATTGDDGIGAEARHRGSGNVRVVARAAALDRENPNIETSGKDADGIQASLGGTHFTTAAPGGDIAVEVSNFHILTKGDASATWDGAMGIRVNHLTEGRVDIDVTGSRIETQGSRGSGIYAAYFAYGSKKGGDIDIDLTDTEVETAGLSAEGIFAYHGSKPATSTSTLPAAAS